MSQPPYGPPPGPPPGPQPGVPQYGMGPQGMPPGPPPPPPQRSTSPILIVILGGVLVVVLVIVAIVLIFAVSNDDEPDPAPPPADGGGSDEMATIGETVSTGNLEYTVLYAETVDVGDNTPSGEYVAVTVDVTNTSDTEWSFWSDEQNIYTTDGAAQGYDSSAHEEYTTSTLESISPGDTLTADIVFDVTSSSDVSHIGLSEETLGGNEVEVDLSGQVTQGASGESDSSGSDGDLVPMGDTAYRDPFEMVVTDFETGVDIPGSTPSGEFVVLHLEVTNTGSSERSFWADEQTIYLNDGTSSGYASTPHEDNGGEWYDDVAPDETVETSIVFDVSSASDVDYVGLSAETFGDNEINVEVS